MTTGPNIFHHMYFRLTEIIIFLLHYSVKITPTRSNECIPASTTDLPTNKVKPGSRKNSIVSFLFPSKSPQLSPEEGKSKKFLSPGATESPKSKKFLKKTASVLQLYNSVLSSLKTISKTNEDVMPELTKKFFEKILRESEKNDELQVTKVKVSEENEFGRHFCSQVNSLEIGVKLAKDQQKQFQLVIKSQPPENARKFLTASRTFEREVEMYSLVLPDMASFVLSVTACDETEVLPVPRCYFSRCEGGEQSKEDMIIMENLLQQGFVFRENGDDTTNKAHVEMVMQEIAKFHVINTFVRYLDQK